MSSILRCGRLSRAYNVILVFTCLCMTFYVIYLFGSGGNKDHVDPKQEINKRLTVRHRNGTKVINLRSFPWFYELKSGSVHFKDCPVNACEYDDRPESLETSDAVMFYAQWIKDEKVLVKQPGQIWIFFAVESAVYANVNGYSGPRWEDKFNWTMTYLRESDIKFGYGDVVKGGMSEKKDYEAIAKKKTKLVAWFVSHCDTHSKRSEFVKILQKYVPVDVYGTCGTLQCSRETDNQCIEMLERDYKFYLAFENSICDDYVTEKLLKRLKLDIVPIARTGANLSAVLPTKMALNTADFASVYDLAEYIKYLDANLDEYVTYFNWKSSYHIVEPQPFPHCLLCERVHKPEKFQNLYHDVVNWYLNDRCRTPTDLRE